jgi:catechol 2,3-dioxygenase-like lactoylglutathione lyase family enzyme
MLSERQIIWQGSSMETRIKHVAICTENYDRMAEFYKTIFGMKKITNGMTDATGNYNPERGHISDGLIGYALLQRQPGISAGLDHFGFEVDDVPAVLESLSEKYPDILVSKTLDYVPFAGIRAHDPTGNQFDISQNEMANVREGYKESGWEQARRLSHIAMRAIKPARLAKFYQDVFGLEKDSKLSDSENFYLTDGVTYLAIMPCDNDSYRGMKEGLHHLGFRVDSLASLKQDLDQIASHSPAAAPRKIDVGRDGPIRLKNLQACRIGKHQTSDPDGILLDLVED